MRSFKWLCAVSGFKPPHWLVEVDVISFQAESRQQIESATFNDFENFHDYFPPWLVWSMAGSTQLPSDAGVCVSVCDANCNQPAQARWEIEFLSFELSDWASANTYHSLKFELMFLNFLNQ